MTCASYLSLYSFLNTSGFIYTRWALDNVIILIRVNRCQDWLINEYLREHLLDHIGECLSEYLEWREYRSFACQPLSTDSDTYEKVTNTTATSLVGQYIYFLPPIELSLYICVSMPCSPCAASMCLHTAPSVIICLCKLRHSVPRKPQVPPDPISAPLPAYPHMGIYFEGGAAKNFWIVYGSWDDGRYRKLRKSRYVSHTVIITTNHRENVYE